MDLVEITKILVAQLRAETGHWATGLAILEEHGIVQHDRRMPDDGCSVCAMLAIAEEAIDAAELEPVVPPAPALPRNRPAQKLGVIMGPGDRLEVRSDPVSSGFDRTLLRGHLRSDGMLQLAGGAWMDCSGYRGLPLGDGV